jgi:predicted ferric reductase
MDVDTAMWVIGRGMGVAAILLFSTSVVLGILTRSGRPLFRLPRFSVQLVHRDVSLAACVFVVVHVGTLLIDTESGLTLLDTVIPFRGSYRWFWEGLGTLAVDLLLVIVVTALLRNVLGARLFRAVHWATYAMWPIALAHAIGTGTDGLSVWFLVIAAVCTAAVLGAVAWRCTAGAIEYRAVRRAIRVRGAS